MNEVANFEMELEARGTSGWVQSYHGPRHVGGRVGNRPPWKKSGWAMPTLKIPAVVWKLSGNCLSMKV